MYYIKTEESFDAAHFLSGYIGKCSNIHGHRWRVVVKIKTKKLGEDEQHRGMCVDFKELKGDLKSVTDSFDHTFIYEKNSLRVQTVAALMEEKFAMVEVEFRPTAENFAKYFYCQMKNKGYDVAAVDVYETPNNCASYEE